MWTLVAAGEGLDSRTNDSENTREAGVASLMDQAPFDLFKVAINESTVLCLLILTVRSQGTEAGADRPTDTSDKCITDLVTRCHSKPAATGRRDLQE